MDVYVGRNAMSEEHDSKGPKMLNRRKILSALGASAVGIANLGVGSVSASSEEAEVKVTSPSEEKAKDIVKSNAMGVLKTLRNQGVIDSARLSELEFEPLNRDQGITSNGFASITRESDVVGSSSRNEQNVRKSILMITKKMENGDLCLFVPRNTRDAYATFFTGDELVKYSENSVDNISTNTCFTTCQIKGCGKTWLDPTDQRQVNFTMQNGECQMGYITCCDSGPV